MPGPRRSPARPFLAITLGDPAGLGPLVGALAALDPALRKRCRPLLIGDAWALQHLVRWPSLRVNVMAREEDHIDRPGLVNILHVPHPGIARLSLGKPQRVGGESAVLAVRAALGWVSVGRAAALVTGPVSKESFRLAGVPYPGHTEMLAAFGGVPAASVEMVMAAGALRTVLITRHIPLQKVPKALTSEKILGAVARVDAWARGAFLRRGPRWLLCGLNPHAGDHGLLGTEEQRILLPAVAALRRKGVRIEGPWPADTAWARHAAGQADFVASLYHDQGMIPLKTLDGKRLVNITTGLPWVRTSPGHGTAFDLAVSPRARFQADPTPTLEAARVALDLARVP